MDKLDMLIETNSQPFMQVLDEVACGLIQVSDYRGYAWIDGIMNAESFSLALDIARELLSKLLFRTEWRIYSADSSKLAESKGFVEMLGMA